jgi:hypothetical protein
VQEGHGGLVLVEGVEMDTGKVEYAPDYKSKSQVRRIAAQTGKKYPDMTDKFKAMELRSEHQRLQSAVVEKARAMLARNESMGHECSDVEGTLKATRALVAFESERGITNG